MGEVEICLTELQPSGLGIIGEMDGKGDALKQRGMGRLQRVYHDNFHDPTKPRALGPSL